MSGYGGSPYGEEAYGGAGGTPVEQSPSRVGTTAAMALSAPAGTTTAGTPPLARQGTAAGLVLTAPAGSPPAGPLTRLGTTARLVLTAPRSPTGQWIATLVTGYGTSAALELTASEGYSEVSAELLLEILDPTLRRPPTALVVVVSEAEPGAELSFRIDRSAVLATATADVDGFLGPTSIPVNERWVKGPHTLHVSDGTRTASAPFTVALTAGPSPRGIGPDTDPVALPDELVLRDGVRSWVFQDLTPGGLGSFVFPFNPTERTGPLVQRTVQATHTTARDGRHRLAGGQDAVLRWSASGLCPDQETHDRLVEFASIPRRFYLIDEHNRAWKATLEDVQITHRLRTNLAVLGAQSGQTDWAADYQLSIVIYSEVWKTPQAQVIP